MTLFEQTLKGDVYDVYMKIPTFMMHDLDLENGDWVRLRVGTGYFALVKSDSRSKLKIRDNHVRLPQHFSHTYRVRKDDKVQMFTSGNKLIFKKVK